MAPDMKAADAYITKTFGSNCTRHETDGIPMEPASDKRYDISYKYSFDAGDVPESVAHLYRMYCSMGAYNETVVFLLRDDDGNFQTLSFAQPMASYDYADDNQTKLKNPPVVTGITASTTLINAEYDPETKTITSSSKWRGMGDAYDQGTYQFIDGVFQLTHYVIDPIYEGNIEGRGRRRPRKMKTTRSIQPQLRQ